MPLHPSGEQFEIRHGNQVAVAVEVGTGLRSYWVDGFELLDTYPPEAMADVARGHVLVPWPNRLRDGAYEWEGRHCEVPLNEPRQRNAIHGLVRWQPWRRTFQEPSRVGLELILHPSPAYPFTLRSTLLYELSDQGLKVTIGAQNAGASALPYGAGQHPYLRLTEGLIDDLELRIPARTRLVTDARAIPIGEAPVSGEFDFAQPRPLGPTELDTAYTDLIRDPDGLARVQLGAGGRTLTLWVDPGFPHLMVFTGDRGPAPGRQRQGLGVEPMTCAPNAFQSGRDLIRLEPGETTSATWGLQLS